MLFGFKIKTAREDNTTIRQLQDKTRHENITQDNCKSRQDHTRQPQDKTTPTTRGKTRQETTRGKIIKTKYYKTTEHKQRQDKTGQHNTNKTR